VERFLFLVICQLDERRTLIMRYIKQSTRDDMSGNWNGEILDMDEGKKKNDQLNLSVGQ
jgi:hypothetical protein